MTYEHAILIVIGYALLITLAVPFIDVFSQPDYTDHP